MALEVKNVVGSKIKIKDQNHTYFYLLFFGVLGAAGTSPLKALKNRIIYKEFHIRHPTSCTNYFLLMQEFLTNEKKFNFQVLILVQNDH